MGKFIQGFFNAKNKTKYVGNPTQCIYRSSWELKYMMELDNDPKVIAWASEKVIISYRDGLGKARRYYTDFWVKRQIGPETFIEEVIEIKPYKETIAPVVTSANKKRKSLIREALTYDKNQAKWAAARAYCAKKGWTFRVLTEYELGIKTRK